MGFILGKTIAEIFLERVQVSPGLLGFQFKPTRPEMGPVGRWKLVTFKEFHQECKLISFGLMALGVQKGDRVVILSNTRFEWSLVDMAVLGASAVTVPIYASGTAGDAAHILEHSGARVAFIEDFSQLAKLIETRAENPAAFGALEKIIVFDPQAVALAQRDPRGFKNVLTLQALRELGSREEGRTPLRFEENLRAAEPSDLMTICYTSGTTGIPKGVEITHDNLMSVLEDCVAVLGKFMQPEGEVVLASLPFSHIFGKVESLAVYTFGWKCVFSEGATQWLSELQEIQPTLIFSVPRFFEKAYLKILQGVDVGSFQRKKLFEWAVQAGQRYYTAVWARKRPLLRDQLEFELARTLVFRRLVSLFGGRLKFAVCGGAPLARELGEFFQMVGVKILEGYGLTETCAPIAVNSVEDTRFGVVGKPLPEVVVKIAPDGEILVKSRKVFKAYFKMQDETQQVFVDEWLHSGDIGFLDSDGFLHITDRKKDLIVTSGGKNIAPQKIENLAKSQKVLSQFVVLGDRRSYLTALLTLDREQVIRYANENQILYSEYAELIKNSKIILWVEKMVEEINRSLAPYERVKKFLILPNEFTIQGGELTPSLKVRRNVVSQKYQTELDRLYGDAGVVPVDSD